MTRSIRIHFQRGHPEREHTLDGYVFDDMQHAQRWLEQGFVDRKAIWLEEVEVGELERCRHCGGSGHRRSIRRVRSLTCDEFLETASEPAVIERK